MKTLLEYVAEVADESNPVNTILSVAELIRSQSESENKVAKLHMQAFLTMLRNAGLSIDYEGLLAYFEAEPNLKNKIQQFNDREIVFVAQGDEVDSETLGQPQGDIPPEEKVEKMAKRAMKAREGIEADLDDFSGQSGKRIQAKTTADDPKPWLRTKPMARPWRKDEKPLPPKKKKPTGNPNFMVNSRSGTTRLKYLAGIKE